MDLPTEAQFKLLARMLTTISIFPSMFAAAVTNKHDKIVDHRQMAQDVVSMTDAIIDRLEETN